MATQAPNRMADKDLDRVRSRMWQVPEVLPQEALYAALAIEFALHHPEFIQQYGTNGESRLNLFAAKC